MNNILKMINKICLIIMTLSLLVLSFGCKDNNEEVVEKSSQYKLYECAKESGYEGDYNDFISSVREGGQLNGKIKVTVISDYGNNEFYINEGECFNYTEYLQDDSLFFCGLFYDELYINRYSGIPLEEDICLYACYYSPQDLDYFSTESIGITTRIYELDIDNLDCYKLFDGDEFCTAFYPKLSIDDFEELKRFDGRIGLAWIFRYENRSIKKEYLDENGIPYYKVLFYFIFNEEKTPVEVLRIVNEINSLSNYEAKVDPLVYPD